jgi:hypothetical protein
MGAGESETAQQGECVPHDAVAIDPPFTNPSFTDQEPRCKRERQHPCHVRGMGGGMVSLLPRRRQDSSSASPHYQLNDPDEAPRTQDNKRGSAPTSRTWPGRWGIGHTPNRECAHFPVAFLPFANLSCHVRVRTWRGLWGTGQTPQVRRRGSDTATTTRPDDNDREATRRRHRDATRRQHPTPRRMT